MCCRLARRLRTLSDSDSVCLVEHQLAAAVLVLVRVQQCATATGACCSSRTARTTAARAARACRAWTTTAPGTHMHMCCLLRPLNNYSPSDPVAHLMLMLMLMKMRAPRAQGEQLRRLSQLQVLRALPLLRRAPRRLPRVHHSRLVRRSLAGAPLPPSPPSPAAHDSL